MKSSEFRSQARENLNGKWGKAVLLLLAYVLISCLILLAISLFPASLSPVLAIVFFLFELPFSFGLYISIYKLYKSESSEKVNYFEFLSDSVANFGMAWSLAIQVLLKLLLPFILIVIAEILVIVSSTFMFFQPSSMVLCGILLLIGIITVFCAEIVFICRTYYYAMIYPLAADNPSMTANEIVAESKRLMTKNRFKLFCLELSFIGWAILSIFTFGIGYFFLAPYMMFSTFAFYSYLKEKQSNNIEIE